MADSNYFARMGQLLLRELSVPAERSRLGVVAHRELMRHISGNMARDAAMPMTSMPPSLDQDPSELGPDELAAFVRILLGKLQGPAREQFAAQIMDLLGTEEPAQDDGELLIRHKPNGNGNGGGRANMPQYGDQTFTTPLGHTITTSGAPNNNKGALDYRSRRPAQDAKLAVRSLNSGARARGFASRWPGVNVSFSGTGR